MIGSETVKPTMSAESCGGRLHSTSPSQLLRVKMRSLAIMS